MKQAKVVLGESEQSASILAVSFTGPVLVILPFLILLLYGILDIAFDRKTKT